MNMNFYKEHIKEELGGAKTYICWAIELKGSKPAWSKSFAEMSADELKHAEYVYKMFREHYDSISGAYKSIPEYLKEMYSEIMEMYDRCSSEVKSLHDMYKQ